MPSRACHTKASWASAGRTRPCPRALPRELPEEAAGTGLPTQDLLAVGGDLTLVEQVGVHGCAFQDWIGWIDWGQTPRGLTPVGWVEGTGARARDVASRD